MEPTRTPLASLPPQTGPPNSSRSGVSTSRRIMQFVRRYAVFIAIALALITLGIIIILQTQAKQKASKSSSSTQPAALTNLTQDDLKKFEDAQLAPTTAQVVSLGSNVLFKNNVTVDKLLSTRALNVSGTSNLSATNVNGVFNVSGGTTLQGVVEVRQQLTVRGSLAAASASFSGDLTVAGNLTAGSLSLANILTTDATFNGVVTLNGHVVSGGLAPTPTPGLVIGAGAQISPVAGNDQAGTIVFRTGSGTAAGELIQIHFRAPYKTVPKVLITPIGQNTGSIHYFTSRNAQFFTIGTSSNGPPTDNTEYAFDYWIIQ